MVCEWSVPERIQRGLDVKNRALCYTKDFQPLPDYHGSFPGAEDIVGKSLSEFHGDPSNKNNWDSQIQFVKSNYRLEDLETQEVDTTGHSRNFLNNVVGVVNDGCLMAVWGTQRDITHLKEAERKIKSSLKEKETLLKEIPHRVKNNMQIISSLLNLQLADVKNKDEHYLRKAFIECRDRIYSMAYVHQILYQSDNFTKIDLRQYTTECCLVFELDK